MGLGAPAPLPPLSAARNSRVPLEMVAVCAAAQPRKPSRPAIPPLRLGCAHWLPDWPGGVANSLRTSRGTKRPNRCRRLRMHGPQRAGSHRSFSPFAPAHSHLAHASSSCSIGWLIKRYMEVAAAPPGQHVERGRTATTRRCRAVPRRRCSGEQPTLKRGRGTADR